MYLVCLNTSNLDVDCLQLTHSVTVALLDLTQLSVELNIDGEVKISVVSLVGFYWERAVQLFTFLDS